MAHTYKLQSLFVFGISDVALGGAGSGWDLRAAASVDTFGGHPSPWAGQLWTWPWAQLPLTGHVVVDRLDHEGKAALAFKNSKISPMLGRCVQHD